MSRIGPAAMLLAAGFAQATPLWRPSQYHVAHWGPAEGLPEESLTSLLQDRDGFLWISTLNGLVRFDGSRFRVFLPRIGDQPISSGIRTAVYDQATRSIWSYLFTSRQIARFDGQRFESAAAWPRGPQSGVLSWRGRAALLDGRTLRAPGRPGEDSMETVLAAPAGQITAVASGPGENDAWVGMEDGRVLQASGAGWQLRARAAGGVTGLSFDASRKTVWGVCNKGVVEIREGRPAEFHPLDGAMSLSLDDRGTVWAGTAQSGLHWKPAGQPLARFEAPGLPETGINALFHDRDRNLWIATWSSGLYRLSRPLFANWGQPEGMGTGTIRSVLESEAGVLWVGENDGTIRRRTAQGFEIVAKLNSPVVGLVSDGQGTAWAVARSEWAHLTAHRVVRGLVPSGAILRGAVYSQAQKTLRFLAEDGLWRLDATGQGLEREPVEGLPPGMGLYGSLAESRRGDTWVCSKTGIYSIRNGRAERLAANWEHPNVYTPFACYADAEGDLWVGMNGGGLFRIRNGEVRQFRADPGDPWFFIYGLGEDRSGHLWLAYRAGLARVAKAELNRRLDAGRGEFPRLTQVWDTRNGLRSANFGRTTSPLGALEPARTLWFVSLVGLVEVDTEAGWTASAAPHLFVHSVQMGSGKLTPQNGTVRALAGGGALRVDVEVVSLSQGQVPPIRYRLEGLAQGWSEASPGHLAEFVNLAPAEYRFRAQARLPNGQYWVFTSLR